MDFRDWFIAVQVGTAWAYGGWWIYVHPSDTSFVTWCGLCSSMAAVYHWLVIKDSKEKDQS